MLPSSKKPSCLLPAFCLGQHFLEVLGVEKWELLWLGRAAWRSELPFTPVNLGSVFLTPAFAIATFVRIFDRRRVTSRLQIFQQKYQKAAGSLFFSWRKATKTNSTSLLLQLRPSVVSALQSLQPW